MKRVRFPSLLLKLTTTAIVLNKGIVFSKSILSVTLFTTSGHNDNNMQSSFWVSFIIALKLIYKLCRCLIACTWAPLPLPRTTAPCQHQRCSHQSQSQVPRSFHPVSEHLTIFSFFLFFFGCAIQLAGT